MARKAAPMPQSRIHAARSTRGMAFGIAAVLGGLFAGCQRPETSVDASTDHRAAPAIAAPDSVTPSQPSTTTRVPSANANDGDVEHTAPPAHTVLADTPWGQAPGQVAPDFDAQRAGVAALHAAGHLERLAVQGNPGSFDAEAYRRDPAPYLNAVVPSRIWQTAQPGPGIHPLHTPDGFQATGVSVRPLANADLIAQALPGWPVTFTSLDRGAFQNGLTSITIQADPKGRATAIFTATAGTTDEVRVIAASPVTSDHIDFRIVIPAQ